MEIHEMNPLFEEVQMQRIFADGKTFVDCISKKDPVEILKEYEQQKSTPGFSLKEFVSNNFDLPDSPSSVYQTTQSQSIEENLLHLWDTLTRKPDKQKHFSALLNLPYQYIVPGGRFGEIYYWDSYFTMLGLKESGRSDMIENMVKNFSFLIETQGYIPNGNRTYFLGRSQPPFFSLMVRLLANIKGKDFFLAFLSSMEKEHLFWMKGNELVNEKNFSAFHSVRMPGGEIMNRYWDENETPRPESYREDVELAQQSGRDHKMLYRHLRAGAESGWDYSSRWFNDGENLASINTANIIPVDLNCLLFHLEQTLAEAYQLNNDTNKSKYFRSLSEQRAKNILQYCWNAELNFFVDFDLEEGKQKQSLTLAGIVPLFFNIASNEQAKKVAVVIKEKFLQPGGVVTTLKKTGQQWDAPNGWAPLQWMTIIGLENYGFTDQAKEIALRWIALNKKIFLQTGKMMEKYDVMDLDKLAGGGEYPGQDGFGWTNGVYLSLIKKFGKP